MKRTRYIIQRLAYNIPFSLFLCIACGAGIALVMLMVAYKLIE